MGNLHNRIKKVYRAYAKRELQIISQTVCARNEENEIKKKTRTTIEGVKQRNEKAAIITISKFGSLASTSSY